MCAMVYSTGTVPVQRYISWSRYSVSMELTLKEAVDTSAALAREGNTKDALRVLDRALEIFESDSDSRSFRSMPGTCERRKSTCS